MIKDGLVFRLTITTVFAALTVGFVATQIFSKISTVDALQQGQYQIEQLNQTVSATASIAAYLEDEELAKEVVRGLVHNDYIKSASIVLAKNNSALAGQIEVETSQSFDIKSPFEKDKTVGYLKISPDTEHLQKLVSHTVRNNILAIVSLSIAVTLAVSCIAYFLITRSIITIAHELLQLNPGGSDRLRIPNLHNNSEIGVLARGVNSLLEKYEQQFSRERDLRIHVESLEKKFRMLFENSVSSIVLTDKRGNIILANNAFKTLISNIGIVEKHNYGTFLSEIFADSELMQQTVRPGLVSNNSAAGDFRMAGRRSSDRLWVHVLMTSMVDGYEELYQFTINDISKTKEYIEQLGHRASTDHLTGLLNRQGAEIRLTQLVEEDVPFALVIMDLNKFKPINDTYGHDSGDEILQHVAMQLKKSMRSDDICCRWGGDEFLLGILGLPRSEAVPFLEKIVANVMTSYRLTTSSKMVSVGVSVGVSFFPELSRNLTKLVRQADIEMYVVKEWRSQGVERSISLAAEDQDQDQDQGQGQLDDAS